jgi:hypothetical protein
MKPGDTFLYAFPHEKNSDAIRENNTRYFA